MATPIILNNDDLLAPVEAIDNLLTAARAQATTAEVALAAAQAGKVAEDAELAADVAEIAVLEGEIAKPVIGLACGSTQAGWDASPSKGATGLRVYGPLTGLPAAWPKMPAHSVVGPTDYVFSANPAVTDYPQVPAWVHSLDGHLAFRHEPEQKRWNLTPAAFRAEYDALLAPARTANPAVKIGAIFQTWTVTTGTPGKNAWLTALEGLALDYIGWDWYVKASAGYPSAASTLGPCLDLANSLFPGIEQLVCEWGVSGSGAPRAAAITSGYEYCAQRGVKAVYYFNENVTGQEAWLLNGDTAAVAAFEGLGA